jgi:acetyl esterase/lipase
MDLYYPAESTGRAASPAVVFVTGFPDAGAERMLGCRFKDMGSFVSWAQLVAVSGLVAVTYENRQPVEDAAAVLQHVRAHAARLGIDGRRIGIWSCSGHGPTALSLLMQRAATAVTCAVLYYPYTLDRPGDRGVADAASRVHFANACAAASVDDLLAVPLFIARAGQDQMPGLNIALDHFLGAALARNLPVTFVNHATAPHAFDLFDDGDVSREIVRQTVAFLRFRT